MIDSGYKLEDDNSGYYGIDDDGNQIVSPTTDGYYEDYYSYYESFSYSTSTYYESFSYSETYYDEGVIEGDMCSNDLFMDANGGCDYYEDAIINPGDDALICPMSEDFAIMDGVTALACCDVCASV
jgi:hypothetical protein